MLGLTHRYMKHGEQALYYFNEALHIRESQLAEDHPSIACTCYELGILFEEQADYTQALDYARRALNIQEQKLSPEQNECKQTSQLVERLMSKLVV